jgi:peptide/nickel transport system ATP-binding protein
LSVVKFVSDVMAVMHDGKIVDVGPLEAIYSQSREECTKRLIASVPSASLDQIRQQPQRRRAAHEKPKEPTL